HEIRIIKEKCKDRGLLSFGGGLLINYRSDSMIDEKATRDNVDKFLKRFHSYRRLSGITVEQVNDSIIEQLPNVECSKGEELSMNLQRTQQAQMIFKSIFEALKKLPNHGREKIEQRY